MNPSKTNLNAAREAVQTNPAKYDLGYALAAIAELEAKVASLSVAPQQQQQQQQQSPPADGK